MAFLTAIAPTVLWIALIAVLVWRFEEPIRREVLPRIGSFGFMGVSVSFVQRTVHEAIEKPNSPTPPPGADDLLVRRLKASGDLLREASILWLDDHPAHNVTERRFFSRFGAWVELARTTDEALEALKWARYDVVISDRRRDAERPVRQITDVAGGLLAGARVIYYVANHDPSKGVPVGAFQMTNRPDELYLHVLDALERRHAEVSEGPRR